MTCTGGGTNSGKNRPKTLCHRYRRLPRIVGSSGKFAVRARRRRYAAILASISRMYSRNVAGAFSLGRMERQHRRGRGLGALSHLAVGRRRDDAQEQAQDQIAEQEG